MNTTGKVAALKTLATNFSDETSALGLSRIRNNTGVLRVFWLVVIVALWLIMLHQCEKVASSYFAYPTTTAVTVQSMPSVAFPAVTLCNLNPVKMSRSEHLFYDVAKNEGLMRQVFRMDENPDKLVISKEQDSMKSRSQTESLISQVLFDHPNESVTAGHFMNESLIDCTYQGYPCDYMNVTVKQWQHGFYGNCFTFYVKKENSSKIGRSSVTGPDGGLSLLLYAQEQEYLPNVAQSVGYRAEIHSAKHAPFPEDNGFTVSAGSHASIPMKAFRHTKMPSPYSTCIEDTVVLRKEFNAYIHIPNTQYNKSYTTKACTKSCYHKVTNDRCHCVNPKSLSKGLATAAFGSNVRACKFNKMKDSKCYSNLVQNESMVKECADACRQPCFFMSYTYRVETSSYPCDKYIDAQWTDLFEAFPWIQEDFSSSKDIQTVFDEMGADPKDSQQQKSMFKVDSSSLNFVPEAEKTSYSRSGPDSGKKKESHASQMMAEMMIKKFVKDNLLLLDIYFEDLNLEKIEEMAKIEGFDLFSSIGGLIGLFIGMSIVTVIELLMCCKVACAICCCGAQNTSSLSNVKDDNRIVRTFSKIKRQDSEKFQRSCSAETVEYNSRANIYGGHRLSRVDLIPTTGKDKF